MKIIKEKNLVGTIRVQLFEIPENLLSQILSNFVDDATAYLTEAWGFSTEDFTITIQDLDEGTVILS